MSIGSAPMDSGVVRVQDTAPHLTEHAYEASVLDRCAVTPVILSKLKDTPSVLDQSRSNWLSWISSDSEQVISHGFVGIREDKCGSGGSSSHSFQAVADG